MQESLADNNSNERRQMPKPELDTLRHRPPHVQSARVAGDVEQLRELQRRSVESPKRKAGQEKKRKGRQARADMHEYFDERAADSTQRDEQLRRVQANEHIAPINPDEEAT